MEYKLKEKSVVTLTGWIIYNGSLQSKKFLDFAMMLQLAAKKQYIDTILFTNNQLLTYLYEQSKLLTKGEKNLPDFVIFTDKDIYLAQHLEMLGIPVFNRAEAIEISDDKIRTYQLLAKQHLPIPKTIVAPKAFSNHHLDHFYNLELIIETLGLPLIVKEAFGSFGEQVYLIHTKEELRKKVHEIHGKAFLFQQFIETSYGKDIRLQVVGNQVVTAMKRTSKDDFRANITTGGEMEAYYPSEREKTLAIQATQAIGADFAGVDLLFGENEQPIICEINSNAHIRNIYECTHINPADFIIDHIIQTLGIKDEKNDK